MHVKTMEGLAGAGRNYNLLKVPIRVFKEARRTGDMGTMERAMEYASDFAGKTREYQAKAEEGMKEDAREARERKKLELEKALERRKQECEKAEEQAESSNVSKMDILEVSNEGKAMLEQQQNQDCTKISGGTADMFQEPLLYHQTGEAETMKPAEMHINISI